MDSYKIKVGEKEVSKNKVGEARTAIVNAEKASKEILTGLGYVSNKVAIKETKKSFALRLGVSVANLESAITELATSHDGEGKREKDIQFQLTFNVLTSDLWKSINDTEDATVKACMTALVDHANNYVNIVGIDTEKAKKRTDFRCNIIATVGGMQEGIKNFFGGWSDGSKRLRNQYGNGRLVADANSNLDGDLVDKDIRQVLKSSSPYNNGQLVPEPKSTGYEVKTEPELVKVELDHDTRESE